MFEKYVILCICAVIINYNVWLLRYEYILV